MLRRHRYTHRFTVHSALILPLLFMTASPLPQTEDAGTGDEGHAHEHEHEEHDETETIVVTGSPLEHSRDELAIPVDRIEKSEMLGNLGSTLGETLSRVPGLTTTGFAGGASRPVVRGQDAFRTEVLEDGLRTQDVSQESPDHGVPINPLAAKRTEIIRGPATVRYGGGASAGVVNVITNRVPDRKPGEAISGDVYGGIGLLANERDMSATLDGAFGDVAWHADGAMRRANNYSIPNDSNPHTQPGTQVESYTGSVGAAWIGDVGRLGFAYIRAEDRYGIPEDDEPVEIDMNIDRYRIEGDLTPELPGIEAIRVRGVYSDYEHDEIASNVVGQTYRNEEFDGRVELVHQTFAGFSGAVGFHARNRDFRAEGEAAEFLAPTDTVMAAGYFFEERALTDDLHGEVGFRVEHTNVEGLDVDDIRRDLDFVPLSGSAALLYDPLDWLGIGLNGSISQRAPTQVELLAGGPHEATSTYEVGDPDLDEETSYTGELRATAKSGRGRLEGAFFVTRYEGFIYGSLTGNSVDEDGLPVADPDDPDALLELLYSDRDALFYGGELSGQVDLIHLPFGEIGIDGRFDIVRARFTDGDDSNLPRIVPIRWGGGVYFAGDAIDARVGFVRNERQDRTSPFDEETASFTWLDASLTYRFEPIDGLKLEANVIGRNLNDVRGRNHVAFNKEDILLPGRSIRFGLRMRF
ncbi:MAG: TonB-dependent receptor [Deltaproteobacteria bacterium]|nr:TonB-dependent receptor [Deltaproteobacteria bacterium]